MSADVSKERICIRAWCITPGFGFEYCFPVRLKVENTVVNAVGLFGWGVSADLLRSPNLRRNLDEKDFATGAAIGVGSCAGDGVVGEFLLAR